MIRILFVAVLAAGLVGCAPREFSLDRPLVSRLSPKEAIALAQKALSDGGFKPQPADAYTLAYQITPGAREWSVRLGPFNPEAQWVVVNDETQEAVVHSERPYPPMYYLKR